MHVNSFLESMPLTKLTHQKIEALFRKKEAEGLSTGSIHNIAAVLSSALNRAVKDGKISANPAARAERPPLVRKEQLVLDHEQILSLLEAAEGDRFEAVYLLVSTSGMRESEIFGLRWRDVNLGKATAKITGCLSRLPKDSDVPEGAVFLEGRWVLIPPRPIEAGARSR
jgi:integrase